MAVTRLGSYGYGTRRTGSFAGKSPATGGEHNVTKITRLGSAGYGTQRTGSFAGKESSESGNHPVVNITRLSSSGHATRRAGSFAGKEQESGGAHPVVKITRLGSCGYGTRRAGDFSGKEQAQITTPAISMGGYFFEKEYRGKRKTRLLATIDEKQNLLDKLSIQLQDFEKQKEQVKKPADYITDDEFKAYLLEFNTTIQREIAALLQEIEKLKLDIKRDEELMMILMIAKRRRLRV